MGGGGREGIVCVAGEGVGGGTCAKVLGTDTGPDTLTLHWLRTEGKKLIHVVMIYSYITYTYKQSF